MTSLSRITLASILMGSLAMPVLAQTSVTPGNATPGAVTKSEPQNATATPAKSLHKVASTPSVTKKAPIHHAATKDTGATTGATTGTPHTN
jgi:hypothetical protein